MVFQNSCHSIFNYQLPSVVTPKKRKNLSLPRDEDSTSSAESIAPQSARDLSDIRTNLTENVGDIPTMPGGPPNRTEKAQWEDLFTNNSHLEHPAWEIALSRGKWKLARFLFDVAQWELWYENKKSQGFKCKRSDDWNQLKNKGEHAKLQKQWKCSNGQHNRQQESRKKKKLAEQKHPGEKQADDHKHFVSAEDVTALVDEKLQKRKMLQN